MKKQFHQNPLFRLFSALKQVIYSLEDALIVFILAAMILLAGSQIFLRNFMDLGLAWGDPLLRLSVLWVGMLGAMAATRDDNHISIDVLDRFLPAKARYLARMINDLFTASVCAIVAYYAGLLVILEKQEDSIAFANVPAWLCELIIPIGFGVMALRFLLSFLLHLFGRAGSADQQEEAG